ncbi:MAG TPA: VWA domain-containing protein [Gammaproteobacteria bacterium]
MLLAGTSAVAQAAAPRDVMLVLDNSGSMRANDPARLSVSAVTDFIRSQSSDTRVGIVIFAGSPTLTKPLTPVMPGERERLLGGLDNLDFSGQWTETAAAVERALYELRVNGREDAGKAIILMTDGIIDTGNAERDLEKARWLRERLTEEAREQDVRIFGIAFTENADYELLQSVSQATDGEYFRALRAQDIAGVMARINDVLGEPALEIEAEAFVTAEPEPIVPATQEPERLVYTPPELPPESSAETESVNPPAENAASADDEESPWRLILIVAALIVLGAVGVGILWGDEVVRLWQSRNRLLREPEDHGPKAVLYDVYDPSDIKRHELGAKPAVIGRVSGSDPAMDYVVVDERTVGRWHATIERRGQSFWIRDEGSVNGTFVNDQRVTAEHPLKHGDMVRVHRHEFEFVIPELFDSDRTMISPEAKMKRPDAAAEEV